MTVPGPVALLQVYVNAPGGFGSPSSVAEPLKIAYSDWPGFIAKETAEMKELARKGGIKEE